jgi:FAD/FMN-containing dehydrogenase
MAANNLPSEMTKALHQDLMAIVAEENVILDEENRTLLSHDVFYRPDVIADSVVTPTSTQELADVAAVLQKAGMDMHVRGGGMSYTDAYTPVKSASVLIDMRKMNRIVELNEEDMYVTVQTGCTWAELNAELEARNLRTPFWGPLSGLVSTIGGGLSQNNAFFGGSTWGTTSESLIALKVVVADGTVIETGSASTQGGKPFYRYYGPDLTGIFTGDSGAMGIKTEATFRLIRRPAETGFASFEFSTAEHSAAAMSTMSREGLGAELFGFDPGLTAMAMSRGTWSDKVKIVKDLAKAEGSAIAGIKQAAKTAIAGKSIAHRGGYSLHIVCDGRSMDAVNADLDVAREIAARHHGKEIDNSVAKVVRAAPFGPVDSMVGPNGERWVPTHGIVAHSDAPKIWKAMHALFEKHAAEIEAHDVSWGFLTCTMASNGFLIEPVMIWPDELWPMHRHFVRDEHLTGIPTYAANPEAREFVTVMRARLVEIFSDFKAVHFQIGKAYPYREHRKAPTWALVEAIKAHVDPKARINPGCLGLDPGGS